MGSAGIAMLSGVLALLALPVLPAPLTLICVLLPATVLVSLHVRLRIFLWLILGFAWTWYCAQAQLALRLAPELEGRELTVSGWVASLPKAERHYTGFEFTVERLDGRAPGEGIPKRLRLSWSDTDVTPAPGSHWQFRVRLRRPRGFMNPGSFDHEGWLFRHGIGAGGYVVRNQAQRLDSDGRFPLLRARAAIRDRMRAALTGNDFMGVAAALAIGDRNDITPAQWRVFQDTSTAHLVAISGLHIGLVAGLMFLLVKFLWRRSARLCERWPAPLAAACAALLAAAVYSAMAGFSVPTQRALIMLSVAALAALRRRRLQAGEVLGMALLGVLLLDPLSAGEIGFWLSFGAVAAILFVFSNRVMLQRRFVTELLRTQWAVGIALLPLLVFFFQRASWVAPLANLVAVPLYSFVVVPLVLAGTVLLSVWHWGGALLLKLAAGCMSLSWPFLERLAQLPVGHTAAAAPGVWLLALALLGALWLMLPRGIPARWLGVLLFLPVFVPPPSGIPVGGFTLSLLDVGQGLSAVVRTANHTLVYDTGPGFSDYSDAGQQVVVPWLQNRNVSAPDLLMVSHGDNDHAGGVPSLRRAYPRLRILAGMPDKPPGAELCVRGQQWEWDGVRFRVLYPDADNPRKDNNASCVLKVEGASGSALLTGDLMRVGEQRLLATEIEALPSDVLVVPHHGSASSSSPAFVQAVRPRYALFPVGHRNRWGFPKPAVRTRYAAGGTALLDTAAGGALELRVWPGSAPQVAGQWRLDHAHFWTEH